MFQVITGGTYVWSFRTSVIRVWAGPVPMVQLLKCTAVEVVQTQPLETCLIRLCALFHAATFAVPFPESLTQLSNMHRRRGSTVQ